MSRRPPLPALLAAAGALLLALCLGLPAVGRTQEPPPVPAGPAGPAGAVRVAAPAGAIATLVPLPVVTTPSRALGLPSAGRLRHGYVLPQEGPDHFTWDDTEGVVPDPDWRRVGTDTLVTTILTVVHRFRQEHPEAARVGVQDLSLPEGGPFGPEYGGLGHGSHQNGLDVDIAYPRKDRRERGLADFGPADKRLSQALVTLFVKAGAQLVFVGPHTGLKGPKRVVEVLADHDDHLHVRIPNPRPRDVRALRRAR